MLPRLVATDLDGTIVRSDGTISERTVAALRSMDERGVQIVFATGRPPRWMHPVVDATGLAGPAICSNGAQVFDTASGEILAEHTLDPATARAVANDMRSNFPAARFAIEIGLGFGHEPDFSPGWDPPPDSWCAPVDELLGGPVVKLMARCRGEDPDELLALSRKIVDERASVTRSIGISLVEICRRGVDKSTTLATLAAGTGVSPAEVIAFGDQSNDAGMLAWAHRSYAVANAHPHAREAAAFTTASVEDDGVALVLEDLLGRA